MRSVQCQCCNAETDDFRPFADAADYITFPPGSRLPIHFIHWRIPINGSYTVSPAGHPNTLRLSPSKLNLTAYDGNYAGPEGQTFVGRRQTDTLFTYSVNLQFSPQSQGDEAGISVFLTQVRHSCCTGVWAMLTACRTTTLTSGSSSCPIQALQHRHSLWHLTSASQQLPTSPCRRPCWFPYTPRSQTTQRCRIQMQPH